MKTLLLFFGMLCTSANATTLSKGYILEVHVYATHWFTSRSPGDGSVTVNFETLDATIGNKHLQLMASDDHAEVWLLALGNYKARLVKDAHKPTGETSRIYELLLPGGQARRFVVVGQSE